MLRHLSPVPLLDLARTLTKRTGFVLRFLRFRPGMSPRYGFSTISLQRNFGVVKPRSVSVMICVVVFSSPVTELTSVMTPVVRSAR